jgi:hypothetical protein
MRSNTREGEHQTLQSRIWKRIGWLFVVAKERVLPVAQSPAGWMRFWTLLQFRLVSHSELEGDLRCG